MNEATTLATDPIDDEASGKTAGKKKAGKKKTVSAAVKPVKAGKTFSEGDDVLLKVRHFHGYHATVTNDLGNDQYVVRINDENHAGLLGQFSADELEPLSHPNELKKHQNDRVKWDYEN